MARGLVRFQQCGCFHFLTFSCYHRLAHLGSAKARTLFEAALERIRVRYLFVVTGYVVMPEHVHMLVSEPREGVLAFGNSGAQAFGGKKAARESVLAGALL